MGGIRTGALGLSAAKMATPAGLIRDQCLAQAKGHLPTSATIGGLFARDY